MVVEFLGKVISVFGHEFLDRIDHSAECRVNAVIRPAIKLAVHTGTCIFIGRSLQSSDVRFDRTVDNIICRDGRLGLDDIYFLRLGLDTILRRYQCRLFTSRVVECALQGFVGGFGFGDLTFVKCDVSIEVL